MQPGKQHGRRLLGGCGSTLPSWFAASIGKMLMRCQAYQGAQLCSVTTEAKTGSQHCWQVHMGHSCSSAERWRAAAQIPWMQHGNQQIADSRFIVRFLQNTYGSQLKTREPEDAVDQALSTTVQRLCEQHMYFTALYHGACTPEACSPLPAFVHIPQADFCLHVMSLCQVKGPAEILDEQLAA